MRRSRYRLPVAGPRAQSCEQPARIRCTPSTAQGIRNPVRGLTAMRGAVLQTRVTTVVSTRTPSSHTAATCGLQGGCVTVRQSRDADVGRITEGITVRTLRRTKAAWLE